MNRHRRSADEYAAPVMVPRNDKGLVAVSPDRVRRLFEHVTNELGDLRTAKRWDRLASPSVPGQPVF
jgi:hypothetical protein